LNARTIAVLAPLSGRVVSLDSLPDLVFQQRMLGDGVAIVPEAGEAVAPVAGRVCALYPTGHALGLEAGGGLELLIHIGIESVKLTGVFTPLVAQDDAVAAGQPLVRFDLEKLKAGALSPATPVIVTRVPDGRRLETAATGSVRAGHDVLFYLHREDPSMVEKQVCFAIPEGLHARPAALLAATAGRFRSKVTLVRGSATADARSMLSLMGMGIKSGEAVTVRAEGPDAEASLAAVTALLEGLV